MNGPLVGEDVAKKLYAVSDVVNMSMANQRDNQPSVNYHLHKFDYLRRAPTSPSPAVPLSNPNETAPTSTANSHWRRMGIEPISCTGAVYQPDRRGRIVPVLPGPTADPPQSPNRFF